MPNSTDQPTPSPSSPSLPSEDTLKSLPEYERLSQAATAAQAAATAQSFAANLKSKASLLTDPTERSRLLTQAYDSEVRAHGMSKKARFLKSGTFQGAAGGAGIGGVVGMGLGTVVGTVVGGVVSVPTTVVGGLVGSGVGLAHGPFVKLGGGGKKGEKEGEVVQVSQESIDRGDVVVDKKTGKVTAKNPEELSKAAAAAEQAAKVSAQQQGVENVPPGSEGKPKRKPRKLEVRSDKAKQPT